MIELILFLCYKIAIIVASAIVVALAIIGIGLAIALVTGIYNGWKNRRF